MAATEQGLTTEFATAYREMMLQGLANEVKTSKKILSAVPDDKRDYRPDPHARTAWELAWHLANTDVQFLDGIADLDFQRPTEQCLQADSLRKNGELSTSAAPPWLPPAWGPARRRPAWIGEQS